MQTAFDCVPIEFQFQDTLAQQLICIFQQPITPIL